MCPYILGSAAGCERSHKITVYNWNCPCDRVTQTHIFVVPRRPLLDGAESAFPVFGNVAMSECDRGNIIKYRRINNSQSKNMSISH